MCSRGPGRRCCSPWRGGVVAGALVLTETSGGLEEDVADLFVAERGCRHMLIIGHALCLVGTISTSGLAA